MMISTFISYYCLQINLRAILLYLTDDNFKTQIKYSGMTLIISMPLIGVFDNINHPLLHYMFTFAYFTSMCIFSQVLVYAIIDKVNTTFHYTLTTCALIMSNFMCLLYCAFGIMWCIGHKSAILEWFIAFTCALYIVTLSLLNPFYEEIRHKQVRIKLSHNNTILLFVLPIIGLLYDAIFC
jgi:hypothetical protein